MVSHMGASFCLCRASLGTVVAETDCHAALDITMGAKNRRVTVRLPAPAMLAFPRRRFIIGALTAGAVKEWTGQTACCT
jgi:hypothetical protein